MAMKKTLVIGASSKPGRVSREAVLKLREAGHEVIAIGAQEDKIGDISIHTGHPLNMGDLHTVTLYLNPNRQIDYYDYLMALKPKRIIFNPGTENPVLERLASENNIETEEACTLVLLSLGAY
jgi:predicted CoA-binding protein